MDREEQEKIIAKDFECVLKLDFSKVKNKTLVKAPYYTCYNRIWYRYEEGMDAWSLTDRQDGMGVRKFYNGEMYRIDECLKMFDEFVYKKT